MSKKGLNHKLLKAIAIGISATMAFQPIAVIAEENVDTNISAEAEEAQSITEQASAVTGSVDTADEKTETVGDVIVETNKATVDEANTYKEEINSTYNDLQQNVDNSDGMTAGVEANIGDMASKEETLEAKVESAESKVQDVNTAANDANNAYTQAADQINGVNEQINSASTKDEAQAIYDAVEEEVVAANNEYAKAVDDYTAKKKAYDEALEAAELAKKQYAEAVATASGNVDELAAELEKANENAAKLAGLADKAYKDMEEAKRIADEANEKAKSDAQNAARDVTEKEALVESTKIQVANDKNEIDENARLEKEEIGRLAGEKKDGIDTKAGEKKDEIDAKAKQDKEDKDKEAKEAQTLLDNEPRVKNHGGENGFGHWGGNNHNSHLFIEDVKYAIENTNLSSSYNCADLAYYMVAYKLFTENDAIAIKQGTVNLISWNTDNNYIEIEYFKEGSNKKITEYYDFRMLDKDGNSLSFGQFSQTASIVVLKKTGIPGNFSGKGEQFYTFDDFNDHYSDYKNAKSTVKNLDSEKAKIDADAKAEKDKVDAQAKIDKAQVDTDAKAEIANVDSKAEAAKKEKDELLKNVEGQLEEAQRIAAQAELDKAAAANKLTDYVNAYNAYEKLNGAATEAANAVVIADNRVKALQSSIKNLILNLSTEGAILDLDSALARLELLKKAYEEAKETLAEAEKTHDDINDKLADAKKILDDRLAAIDEENAEGTTPGGTTGGETTGGGAPTDVADAGTAAVAVATTGAAASAVAIEEDNVPLAATANAPAAPAGQVLGATRQYKAPAVERKEAVDRKADDSAKADKKADDKNANKDNNTKATITDEGVALAAAIPVEETKGFSLWWLILLVLAALGITTEEMIRRHNKNMNEENENK